MADPASSRAQPSGATGVLVLADGTVLPVAQSRRTEVAAWLRQVAAGMKTRLDADDMRIIEQTP